MKSLLAALLMMAGLAVARPASAQQYYAFTQYWTWEYSIQNPTRIGVFFQYSHSETSAPRWNLPGWDPAVQSKYQVRTATFTYGQLHNWDVMLLETNQINRTYWDDSGEIAFYAYSVGGGVLEIPGEKTKASVQKIVRGKIVLKEFKGKDIPIPGVPGVTITPAISLSIKPVGYLRRGQNLIAVEAGVMLDAQVSLKAGPGVSGVKLGLAGGLTLYRPTVSVRTELNGTGGYLSAQVKIQPLVGKLSAFVEFGPYEFEHIIYEGGFNMQPIIYPIWAKGFHQMSPVYD